MKNGRAADSPVYVAVRSFQPRDAARSAARSFAGGAGGAPVDTYAVKLKIAATHK